MSPDKKIFVLTLAVGGLISIAYLIFTWKAKRPKDFVKVATIFATTAGFVGGVKLCYLLIAEDAKFSVSWEDKLIIFLGGVAVCWMSVIGCKDCFK